MTATQQPPRTDEALPQLREKAVERDINAEMDRLSRR
jgi:hypothetical protein